MRSVLQKFSKFVGSFSFMLSNNFFNLLSLFLQNMFSGFSHPSLQKTFNSNLKSTI